VEIKNNKKITKKQTKKDPVDEVYGCITHIKNTDTFMKSIRGTDRLNS